MVVLGLTYKASCETVNIIHKASRVGKCLADTVTQAALCTSKSPNTGPSKKRKAPGTEDVRERNDNARTFQIQCSSLIVRRVPVIESFQ